MSWTCGWTSPAMRAHMLEEPTPTFLTTVGKSSAAYTYTMAKAAAQKNLPSSENTVAKYCKSGNQGDRVRLTFCVIHVQTRTHARTHACMHAGK